MDTPGNDVLHEMIRSLKEEQIPAMHRELSNGLASISHQTSQFSIEIRDHHNRITILENYKVGQEGQLGVWKWLISVIGISTVIQWIQLFFTNKQ